MVPFYVFGTQVFPGQEVLGRREDFFRDHRVGDGARWFSLCPHGSETRASRGARQKVIFCRECGQAHYPWLSLESQTIFLPGPTDSRGHFNPLSSLVVFHEADQPLPGKFLIGLPPDQEDSTVVLWRIIIPETSRAVISAVGPVIYRNTGSYARANHTFPILELMALVGKGQGMTVSTSEYRSVLTLGESGISISSLQKVPHTVDS